MNRILTATEAHAVIAAALDSLYEEVGSAWVDPSVHAYALTSLAPHCAISGDGAALVTSLHRVSDMSRPRETLVQFTRFVPLVEKLLGAEHPDTLATRANLAVWRGEAGDAAGAAEQFAALLPIQERVLGPEHPNTLRTRSNLASRRGEAGDAAGAAAEFAVLLPIYERVLGAEHPTNLAIRANLARLT